MTTKQNYNAMNLTLTITKDDGSSVRAWYGAKQTIPQYDGDKVNAHTVNYGATYGAQIDRAIMTPFYELLTYVKASNLTIGALKKKQAQTNGKDWIITTSMLWQARAFRFFIVNNELRNAQMIDRAKEINGRVERAEIVTNCELFDYCRTYALPNFSYDGDAIEERRAILKMIEETAKGTALVKVLKNRMITDADGHRHKVRRLELDRAEWVKALKSVTLDDFDNDGANLVQSAVTALCDLVALGQIEKPSDFDRMSAYVFRVIHSKIYAEKKNTMARDDDADNKLGTRETTTAHDDTTADRAIFRAYLDDIRRTIENDDSIRYEKQRRAFLVCLDALRFGYLDDVERLTRALEINDTKTTYKHVANFRAYMAQILNADK